MKYNPYRLDYFILKEGKFINEEYAIKDYSKYPRKLTVDFYYNLFFYKLLFEYPGIEYLEFLKFQIENSEFKYGFVTFLKEEFVNIKNLCNTEDHVILTDIVNEIMKETKSEKLFPIYGEQLVMDPELQYSNKYFSKFIVSNKEIVSLRVKEINKLLKKYSEDYFNIKRSLSIVESYDVEALKSNGQKIMLMKELGLIDYLIDKYFLMGEININHLSNIIHCFTGLNMATIQSILNPIYNTENDQKNNPYKNTKNIDLVKAKLAELHIKV